MLSVGNARKVGVAPNAKAQGAVFARFAVRVQAGRATTVPMWKGAGSGGGGVPQGGDPSRTYAAVLAGKSSTRPTGASSGVAASGAAPRGAGGTTVRLGAPAPAGGESEWQRLLREEVQARANHLRLAERLRAASEKSDPREPRSSGGDTRDAPSVGADGAPEADVVRDLEGGICAANAREAKGPRASQRRGGAGVARGGGAEIPAGEVPQERPGPSLRNRAPSLGTAPSETVGETQPRKGGSVVRRKAGRQGETPVARTSRRPSLGGMAAGSSPLPGAAAAKGGGAGPTTAEPEGSAEGEFCALRNSLAHAVAGAGSRSREDASGSHDPRAKRRRAREVEAAARAAALELALHAAPTGVARDTQGDVEAGFIAQARFRTSHRPTAGFRRNGDRREALRRAAVEDLMSIMDETAQRRMAGCSGGPSQLSGEDLESVVRAQLEGVVGADGQTGRTAAKNLAFLQGFERARDERSPGGFSLWPLEASTAAIIIKGVHERAVAKSAAGGSGSRGGETVGHAFRASLKLIVSKLGYPMVGPKELLERVAPTPSQAGGDESQSATLALKLIACLEELAATPLRDLARRIDADGRAKGKNYCGAKAAPVVRRIARSLVIGGLGSLRMEEMVDLSLHLDPEGVITGTVGKAKDGQPLRVFVPAEGVLGPLGWAREHTEECCAGEPEGVAFRAWTGPHGAKGDVCKASASSEYVVSKDHLVQAVYRLWSFPPCELSDEDRQLWSYSTHAFHGTWTDVARMVGENPTFWFEVSPGVAKGFSMDDVEALGHWRRLAKYGAPRNSPGSKRKRSPGDAPAMALRYSSGIGRVGEREEQIRVRSRVIALVRAALEAWGQPWSRLPLGVHAWDVCKPIRV